MRKSPPVSVYIESQCAKRLTYFCGHSQRKLGTARMVPNPVYVITDIEVNGPTPGAHSMLAFASVALDHAGNELAVFEAVLQALPEAGEDAITIAWFKGLPEAWAAATSNPQPPQDVMARYAEWVRGLPEIGRAHG